MSIIKRKAGSEDIVKSILEFDEVPTEGSPNLVESGAVAQAISNLGQPLQWKGPATVAELDAGITGIQPGWTYTLTDAGTLTDGNIEVEDGDEVAWTEDGEWFKVGHDSTTEDIQKMIDDAVYSSEIAILSNIPPAAKTLRFSFSKKDYDPTVAGVGTSGTWSKLATTQANVWDWTCSDANWSSIFNEAFRDGNDVAIIASGDLSSVTSMASLFRQCSDIVKVCDLSTTSSVEDFSRTFNGLSNLQKCPFVNTFSATNCQSMFNGCSKIESFSLFDTSNLKNSSYMFSACSALKSITLIDSSAITDTTAMFSSCVNVESGALALYTQMSSQTTPPAIHASCFSQCGKNTTTGAAELAQIPASWGGTMPEP